MDDNQLAATVAKWIALAVIAFVVTCFASCEHRTWSMREAIEAGGEPLRVKCAFRENTNCVLLYASPEAAP